jgi:hypothetical protein
VESVTVPSPLRSPALSQQEESFYRAVHYSAGAVWVLGVAEEAMAAIREVIERALRERDERGAAVSDKDPALQQPRECGDPGPLIGTSPYFSQATPSLSRSRPAP